MTKSISLLLLLIGCMSAVAPAQNLTSGSPGGNRKSSVSEMLGLLNIAIHYDRPGVKGREGKIWGTSVAHYGFQDLGFGVSKAAPWRAGANENTTISFSHDVLVEGKPLAAGTYGLFMALGPEKTTVIFSKNASSWGSFYYDPAEDALRVEVANRTLTESIEWLKFEFIEQTEKSVTVALCWEKRMIPFVVSADLHAIQIASFKRELRTTPGFDWRSFVQAANYCVQNNIELPLALEWAEKAIAEPFIGEENFQTLACKAAVLNAMGQTKEAASVMEKALPYGSMVEVHQYGRTLLSQKRIDEAWKVFAMNYEKHPDVFTTLVGMGRIYSAKGDYAKALAFIKKAQPLAPDPVNRESLANMVKKLEAGKDVN